MTDNAKQVVMRPIVVSEVIEDYYGDVIHLS